MAEQSVVIRLKKIGITGFLCDHSGREELYIFECPSHLLLFLEFTMLFSLLSPIQMVFCILPD